MALIKYKRHLTKCSGGSEEWDRKHTDCYCFWQVNGYLGGTYIRKNTYTFSADLANDMMKKAEKANAWPEVAGKEIKPGEVVTDGRGHTIELAIKEFLAHCTAATGLNQQVVTMKMYRTALTRLMTFCHENKIAYVEGITPEVMAAFRATWAKWKTRNGIGIGVGTGNNYTTYLKGFGDWCVELGYAKKSFTNVLKYQEAKPMEGPGHEAPVLASILFAAETVDLTGCEVDNYRVVTFIHLMNEAGMAICDAALFRKVENVNGEIAVFFRKKMQGKKKAETGSHAFNADVTRAPEKVRAGRFVSRRRTRRGRDALPRLLLCKREDGPSFGDMLLAELPETSVQEGRNKGL